jgi:hypothetical protein
MVRAVVGAELAKVVQTPSSRRYRTRLPSPRGARVRPRASGVVGRPRRGGEATAGQRTRVRPSVPHRNPRPLSSGEPRVLPAIEAARGGEQAQPLRRCPPPLAQEGGSPGARGGTPAVPAGRGVTRKRPPPGTALPLFVWTQSLPSPSSWRPLISRAANRPRCRRSAPRCPAPAASLRLRSPPRGHPRDPRRGRGSGWTASAGTPTAGTRACARRRSAPVRPGWRSRGSRPGSA